MFKLQMSYNGTEQLAYPIDEFVLGLSLNSLIGANDTIAGTNATNLMSLTQTMKEIADWANYAASLQTGGKAIFQFTDLASNDSTGAYTLYADKQDHLLLPDFIAGLYNSAWTDSVAATIANGLPGSLQIGPNISASLRGPLDAVKGIMCAEAMRKTAAWAGPTGDVLVWLDNTTTSAGGTIPNQNGGGTLAAPAAGSAFPTLNVASRDQLPSVNLPYPPSPPSPLVGPKGPMSATMTSIRKCDELIPSAVGLIFKVTGVWNGSAYYQFIYDIAAEINGQVIEGIGLPGQLYTIQSITGSGTLVDTTYGAGTSALLMSALLQPDAISATIDMQGANGSVDTCTFTTVAVDTSSATTAFCKALWPKLANMTSPTLVSGSTPTFNVFDPGGADDGNTVDTDTYQYLLTSNTVAKWMYEGNNIGTLSSPSPQMASIKAKVSISVTGTENSVGIVSGTPTQVPTGHIQQQNLIATPTLVTLAGGTYTRQNWSPGEIIPFGLAGFIYNLSVIPHYEGSYTIQEQEITDQCPMGNNLNITGSANHPEWATMQACVQQITYDYVNATTSLTFGPGKHLGLKDLASRLKTNRGPRWLYQMGGGNIANTPGSNPGTQFGSDVAGKSPQDDIPGRTQILFPSSVTDSATYQSTYADTGHPGITLDNRASGQPNFGYQSGTDIEAAGLSAPTTATLVLLSGSGGTLSGTIRISNSDKGTGSAIDLWVQEVPECDVISGTPTNGFRLYLCSKFYTTSRF